MLERDGVPTAEDLASIIPSEERLAQGAVAIIECFQPIPCDPCYDWCKRGAIKKFKSPTDLPQIDYQVCNGCALCVIGCPGLAIFVVDRTYSKERALLKIPYEFLPLPEKGEVVEALNREGEAVGEAEVLKVQPTKQRTTLVSLLVPQKLAMEVRFFRRRENG